MRRLNREIHAFQPTPSLRRATTASEIRAMRYAISTHALLAEGDQLSGGSWTTIATFQPTPSLRRATPQTAYTNGCPAEISTHALLAEGDAGPTGPAGAQGISTHALLAEGDRPAAASALSTTSISTHALLAEGDREFIRLFSAAVEISTHALLAEGDCARLQALMSPPHFNPRPPCGGRRT